MVFFAFFLTKDEEWSLLCKFGFGKKARKLLTS